MCKDNDLLCPLMGSKCVEQKCALYSKDICDGCALLSIGTALATIKSQVDVNNGDIPVRVYGSLQTYEQNR